MLMIKLFDDYSRIVISYSVSLYAKSPLYWIKCDYDRNVINSNCEQKLYWWIVVTNYIMKHEINEKFIIMKYVEVIRLNYYLIAA